MIQYIKSSKELTPETIIEPYFFEDVKRALIEIFLNIQAELEDNYEIFLDDNFPEDNVKSESENKEDEDSQSQRPSGRSSMKSSSYESSQSANNFKNTVITLKRDARNKFINITERFVESLILNGDENWLDETPIQLEDISLSGTTATVVFQIGKRLITAYVGDSYACVGCREKSKNSSIQS